MKSNIERFRATHTKYHDWNLGPITILELKARNQFNLEDYLSEMERKTNVNNNTDSTMQHGRK